MRTLIFNGSPRANGDTASLIQLALQDLQGEYKVVNAYRDDISPCVDCRYCKEHPGCAIHDGMEEVYRYLEDCDNIIIASPIYFSELTGRLLDVGSRLQMYFSARFFRGERPVSKPKKGGVILVGGGDGGMEKAHSTARTLLHLMNCRDIHELVSCHCTDKMPAIEDGQAMAGVRSLVRFLNSSSGSPA